MLEETVYVSSLQFEVLFPVFEKTVIPIMQIIMLVVMILLAFPAETLRFLKVRIFTSLYFRDLCHSILGRENIAVGQDDLQISGASASKVAQWCGW